MRTPERSSPPFSELPTGLLELVTPPQDLQLVSDRRICCVDASSCCRQLMQESAGSELSHVCDEFKENRCTLSKKIMRSEKKVLGERDLNLGEATTGITAESVEQLGDVEVEKCPSGPSKTILEILEHDSDKIDDIDEDLPPYHPVSAPFSPRPQFLRLKRKAQELEQLPPYDPEVNPLSPRPEFLRYNPVNRLQFLQARDGVGVVKGKRLFPASEQEAAASSHLEEVPNDLRRSLSCPELVSIGEDELPRLEKMPTADVEEQEAEETQQKVARYIPARINWWGLLKRGLLLCLFLFFIGTACIILQENPTFLKGLQQKIFFQTQEWMARDAQEITYPGNWDIISAVSNYSLGTIPEVSEEILFSVEGEESFFKPVDGTGAGFAWTSVDQVSETEDLEGKASALWFSDDLPDMCSRVDWIGAVGGMCFIKSLKPNSELVRQSVSIVHAPGTDSRTLHDQPAETHDAELTDIFLIDKVMGLVNGTFSKAGTSVWSSYLSSILSDFGHQNSAIASFSLLGVASTLIIILRKKRRAGGEVSAAPPSISQAAAPPATISQTADIARPGSASISTISGSSRNSINSNDEYGSFTTMEEVHLGRGQKAVTPVRRSSRIRSRSGQSLKA